MSDEDDVRDKDYGVDGNEYYYNADSDDTRLGHGQPDTKEHDIIEILTSPDSSNGYSSSPHERFTSSGRTSIQSDYQYSVDGRSQRTSDEVPSAKKARGLGPNFVSPNILNSRNQYPTISSQTKRGFSDGSADEDEDKAFLGHGKSNSKEWFLLADVESKTSFKAGGSKKPSDDESRIIKMLTAADGYKYNTNSSTSASTIWRADCKQAGCTVQIKFERANLRLAKYQRGAHIHLPPSDVTRASTQTSNSGKSRNDAINMGRGSLLHPFSTVIASTAAGRSKSPNVDLANALDHYATGVEAFFVECNIEGHATNVPQTIRYAAKNVKKVKYEITARHYPFDFSVCDCLLNGHHQCCNRVNNKNKCHGGEYKITGVGEVIAKLIKSYFEQGGRIPPNYRQHLAARR
jgi:hypothetical protein